MKLNLLQIIAIKWYQTVDSSGFVYTVLKALPLPFRMFFYIGLPISSYIVLVLLSNAIVNSGNPFFQLDIVIYLGNIILYGVPLLCLLYLSYETIYDLDIEKILTEQKVKQSKIITSKKQWWRLRNIHYIFRVLIYLALYLMMINVVNLFAFISIAETYQNPSQELIKQVVNDYEILIQWFTFLYAIIIVVLDTSVYLKRKKLCRK